MIIFQQVVDKEVKYKRIKVGSQVLHSVFLKRSTNPAHCIQAVLWIFSGSPFGEENHTLMPIFARSFMHLV